MASIVPGELLEDLPDDPEEYLEEDPLLEYATATHKAVSTFYDDFWYTADNTVNSLTKAQCLRWALVSWSADHLAIYSIRL